MNVAAKYAAHRRIADELVTAALKALPEHKPATVDQVRVVVLATGADLTTAQVAAALRRLRVVGRAVYHRERYHVPTRSSTPAGWTGPPAERVLVIAARYDEARDTIRNLPAGPAYIPQAASAHPFGDRVDRLVFVPEWDRLIRGRDRAAVRAAWEARVRAQEPKP